MSRAHGVPIQHPQDPEIRDVWHDTLALEFVAIREVVTKYPFIGMVRGTCFCHGLTSARPESRGVGGMRWRQLPELAVWQRDSVHL